MALHLTKLIIQSILIFVAISFTSAWANNNPREDLPYKQAMELFNNQKFDQAITVLNDAIKNNPKEDSYYILIGRAFERLNNKLKAKEYYKKAIELNTNDVWAYIGCSTASEDFAEQEYWAKQAIEKFPYQSTSAVALLNSLYMGQAIQEESAGNIEKALRFLEQAKVLISDYLVILEQTPEDIFEEEMREALKKIDKQTFKKQMEKSLGGLTELEYEWKQKRTQ